MQLICPVCSAQLTPSDDGRNLACENRHSFDRAKQGYWNLLLVQNKRSKDPGDNPEMILARQQFLSAGHYQPVSDTLSSLAEKYTEEHPKIVDLGCGEGYYTERFANALKAKSPDILGLDISKHAIKSACKRGTDITWTVASSAQIPVPEKSIDLAVIVFSRVLGEPMAKILKDTGVVIIAYPGVKHLYSLREAIYETVREKISDPSKELGEGYELIEDVRVNFPLTLPSGDALNNLLMMTPHGQRAALKLGEIKQFTTEVDIHLAVFKQKA